jgi:hypothetical protein
MLHLDAYIGIQADESHTTHGESRITLPRAIHHNRFCMRQQGFYWVMVSELGFREEY